MNTTASTTTAIQKLIENVDLYEIDVYLQKLESEKRKLEKRFLKDNEHCLPATSTIPLNNDTKLCSDLEFVLNSLNSNQFIEALKRIEKTESKLMPNYLKNLAYTVALKEENDTEMKSPTKANRKLVLLKNVIELLLNQLQETSTVECPNIQSRDHMTNMNKRFQVLHNLKFYLHGDVILKEYMSLRIGELENLVSELNESEYVPVDPSRLRCISAIMISMLRDDLVLLSFLTKENDILDYVTKTYLKPYQSLIKVSVEFEIQIYVSRKSIDLKCPLNDVIFNYYSIGEKFQEAVSDTTKHLVRTRDRRVSQLNFSLDHVSLFASPSNGGIDRNADVTRSVTGTQSSRTPSNHHQFIPSPRRSISANTLLLHKSNHAVPSLTILEKVTTKLAEAKETLNENETNRNIFVDSVFIEMGSQFVDVVYTMIEDLFNKIQIAEYKQVQGMFPQLRDAFALISGYSHFVTKNPFSELKPTLCECIVTGMYSLLEQVNSIQISHPVEYLYIAYNSFLYTIGEISKLERILKDMRLVDLVISVQNYVQSVRVNIIDIHLEYCATYFAIDIETSEWSKSRPFYGDTKCNYGIQAWNLYMKGLCRDLFYYCSQPYCSEIFGEILLKSANTLATIYRHILPSRIRTNLFKCDLTYVITCLRSFREIVPCYLLREMNQLCIKLAVYLSVTNSPLLVLTEFLKMEESVHVKKSAQFALTFDKAEAAISFPCIQPEIWNSPKVYTCSSFNPFAEELSIGSPNCYRQSEARTRFSLSLSHEAIWNAQFDWEELLFGCYVSGISYPKLIERIQLRPEFFKLIPNDYPPLSTEEQQDLTKLQEAITHFQIVPNSRHSTSPH